MILVGTNISSSFRNDDETVRNWMYRFIWIKKDDNETMESKSYIIHHTTAPLSSFNNNLIGNIK